MRATASGSRAITRFAAKLAACAAAAFLIVPGATMAQAAAPPAHMAPIDAYLMDRAHEIALARSAAPPSVSKDATVLVLTRTGYETAVTGSNGFVCLVGRGFSGASDWPERWDPRIRAADCENPQAARSMMPILTLRTRLILAGKADAEVIARIKAALDNNEIPPLAPGAMSYMMSKDSYLSGAEGMHNMAHVMFFAPVRDGASWGANAEGAPFFGGSYWFLTAGHAAEEATLPPLSVFLMAAPTWSDGTPVAMHQM